MCALLLNLQAFRKAIGVRIKEETELIEGEVRPDPLAACAMPLTAAACAACSEDLGSQLAPPTPSGIWQTIFHRKCRDLLAPCDSRLEFI